MSFNKLIDNFVFLSSPKNVNSSKENKRKPPSTLKDGENQKNIFLSQIIISGCWVTLKLHQSKFNSYLVFLEKSHSQGLHEQKSYRYLIFKANSTITSVNFVIK